MHGLAMAMKGYYASRYVNSDLRGDTASGSSRAPFGGRQDLVLADPISDKTKPPGHHGAPRSLTRVLGYQDKAVHVTMHLRVKW